MRGAHLVELDGHRLRTGPWRHETGEAYLAPLAGAPSPGASAVRRCLDTLAREGFRGVHTSALTVPEQQAFLECGFEVHERLHLLAHPLEDLGPRLRDPGLRRGRRLDRSAALRVDHASFPTFWRLDRRGLREALAATPVARFRVATTTGGARGAVAGYAVTGRSLDRAYLQRLAVDPRHQGHGLGHRLVLDALWWARARGSTMAMVNTQESNTRALRLYEQMGFEQQPDGLAVLYRRLEPAPA